MNPSAAPQIIGNLCVGIAALAFLLPLQKLLMDYAGKHVNDDQWVKPALFALIPLWLALIVAMSCVTSIGGFDGLKLGRPTVHLFAVAATASLAALTFVLVASYIRPGFTPRGLYTPGIYLVPLATLLLALLSLNPKLGSAFPIQWLRLPWTLVASLSLIVCVGFLGLGKLPLMGVEREKLGSTQMERHRHMQDRPPAPTRIPAWLEPPDR
jgi:hypothetical protein